MNNNQGVAEFYDKNADDYHRHVTDSSDSIYHAYYEKPAIRAALPKLGGLKVISIGCGSGVDARWLKDNGASEVTGVDISEKLIEIAKNNNPDIEFRVMDMERLDFNDSSFDLAYSSLAIHYTEDWTIPLKEAYRVLKPGSKYIFSCGHPIDSALKYGKTNKSRYALLGRKVNKETSKRTIYGDYMVAENNGVKPISFKMNGDNVTAYHRTFSKMLEQIQASGFQIEKLIEPKPTEKLKQQDPTIFEQLNKIPAFMIWVLKK